MTQSLASAKAFFKSACLFEAALLPLALIIAWLAGIDPFANIHFSEIAIFYGLVGTLPLVLLFISLQYATHPALKQMSELIMQNLICRLYPLHWSDLMVLAAIAGVTEEMLFRGVLQPWFELSLGYWGSIFASSVLFGLLHAITPFYALSAGLVSIYLGLTLDYTGTRNLLIPIIMHGFYDFVAFMLLVRRYKKLQ